MVRQVFDAFTQRDVEAILRISDLEVELVVPTAGIAGRAAPYVGHEGMRQYFEDVARIWDELEVVPHEYRQVGDSVVVLGRVYGKGLDGLLVDSPASWVWRVENGKVRAGHAYTSRQEALDAAGLRE